MVLNTMVKIQRDFLWGNNEGYRGMYWIACSKICCSKKEGGLGIKNWELFNTALLSKWKWMMLVEDDSSWKGLLLFKYGDLSSALIHKFCVRLLIECRLVLFGGVICFIWIVVLIYPAGSVLVWEEGWEMLAQLVFGRTIGLDILLFVRFLLTFM